MIVALLPERSIAHISVFPSSVFSISIENYPLLSTHSQALETHRNGLKFWINHFMNGVILDKSFSLVQLSFSHSEKSEPSQAPKIRWWWDKKASRGSLGWFPLVFCTALCRGSDKYLSNWTGWNYETAGSHVCVFISKPCVEAHNVFSCDSLSVPRAGKRNSLFGVTQFTWWETPEMSSHHLQCLPGKSAKMLKLTEVLQKASWLLAVRMFSLWGPKVPRWFLAFRVWLTRATLEATTRGVFLKHHWVAGHRAGGLPGGSCAASPCSLKVQAVPGMFSVLVFSICC